jgi:hypothetical protein
MIIRSLIKEGMLYRMQNNQLRAFATLLAATVCSLDRKGKEFRPVGNTEKVRSEKYNTNLKIDYLLAIITFGFS